MIVLGVLLDLFDSAFCQTSGKQQLDDHVEVPEDIILWIICWSNVVWFAGGFSSMQLDQNKSVGHPALSAGEDCFKDDHVRVSVDALSSTCAAGRWKKSLGQPVLSFAHIGFLFNKDLLALAVWEWRGTLCDQFDVRVMLAVLGSGRFFFRCLVGSPLGLRHW